MSTFRGGPADGVALLFHRGVRYLRVVQAPGGFDVLDMLDDTPAENELVWVYRMVGESRPAHINWGPGRKPRGGFYEFADYEYVEVDDATRERIRDTDAWREWATAQP